MDGEAVLKGIYFEKKEFASREANSFLSGMTLIYKGGKNAEMFLFKQYYSTYRISSLIRRCFSPSKTIPKI